MLITASELYPIGLCFGLGFDTASSILLISVSAIASASLASQPAQVLIFPFLFTAGMVLVDTLDSVFMLLAYTRAALESDKATRHSWRLFKADDEYTAPLDAMKANRSIAMTDLSILMTGFSIAVATIIATIQLMGLAAEQLNGAEQPGLSGSWWCFWLALNDQSGYVGAGIVGCFVLLVAAFLVRNKVMRTQSRRAQLGVEDCSSGVTPAQSFEQGGAQSLEEHVASGRSNQYL